MSKNIIICCDGTGNEFGESKSNVVKLYKSLICDATQIGYYHPGVGTMGARSALTGIAKWWTKVMGLAFGYGISDNVADAYQFLMRNFKPGDNIYVFGFSRGAYTARAICGMLHIVGLLTEGNEGLIPYAIRMIKNKKINFGVAFDFKKTFSRECKPYFVGVWDTVSSVGWVYNAVRFPYTRATRNPDFQIVRHAISIDERRAFFPSNGFGKHHDAQQDILEVLFAGVHSDVGGSYPEDESQLSKIALRWMLVHAEAAGLKVDQNRKADILGAKKPYVAPDPTSENQHESLHGFWWHVAEIWPKIVSVEKSPDEWKKRIWINFGRRRRFTELPLPLVHDSVRQRMEFQPPIGGTSAKPGMKRHPFPYKPNNLSAQPQFVPDEYGKPGSNLSKAAMPGPKS
jgi:uncharacterized protein (DUF2235 family)